MSVFLTPDTEPVDISPEITEIDRGQRFDGVLRFDPDLVVVLESKVCRRWASRRQAAVRAAQRRDGERWHMQPQPLLGFRNAPVRTRVYLTCALDPAEYARRWQGEDWKRVGAHHRNHVREDLWPWLLERGYASERDGERIEPFLRALGRRFAHLRPSMHVSRSWDWAEAERLDDEGLLAGEIHDALNRVLALLDEPLLAAIAPAAGSVRLAGADTRTSRGEDGAALEQEPVQAVVVS